MVYLLNWFSWCYGCRMARKQLVILEDDLDGGEATQTLRFGFQGTEFELDLSDKNAQKLEKALAPFMEAARRVGSGRKRGGGGKASSAVSADTKAVRAWAESNGYEVSSRGRISANVLEAYRAAGN
jgi:hypothetical protein